MKQKTKLWDKGWEVDQLIEDFTVGQDRILDLELAPYDIEGSIAHVTMLNHVGMISDKELETILIGLDQILIRINEGHFKIENHVEDVHSQVELDLCEIIGDIGKKIHLGRSRNDQVLTDIKLYSKAKIEDITQLLDQLFHCFLSKAHISADKLFPGYTHLQIAMPASFGMWYGAWAEQLSHDSLFLNAAYRYVDSCPLGTGAGYGSSAPLDRKETAKQLHFERLIVSPISAQLERGKMERHVVYALAGVASTLNRFAADVCLFNCSNFKFITLPKSYTTGSSIMPHKQNPDLFELIRAHCNKIEGKVGQLSLLTANMPSGYSRDMQLVKEIYFPTFKEMEQLLRLLIDAVPKLIENSDILENEEYLPIFSVEEVNRRVKKGVSFRNAYREVGVEMSEGTLKLSNKLDQHTHIGSIGNPSLDIIENNYNLISEK